MRTTRAVSISLPPAELKQARRLAKETNRSLSGVFRHGLKLVQKEKPQADDEYTSEQRRAIDAELAESLKGPFLGPFDSMAGAISSMKAELRARRQAKRGTRLR